MAHVTESSKVSSKLQACLDSGAQNVKNLLHLLLLLLCIRDILMQPLARYDSDDGPTAPGSCLTSLEIPIERGPVS